jgi:predicted nucleic acid-binding protein
MSFLLDTNVISEWVKAAPNPHVTRWLDEVDEEGVMSADLIAHRIHIGEAP